ncbi:MAG: alpha-glucosidase [Anaerolineae bacterium]
MKRRVQIGIAALLVIAVLALWGIPAALEAYRVRPVNGRLESDLPSRTLQTGPFTVAWDAERRQIVITHEENPERMVWHTVPGVPFAAAARGRETVEEKRGSFFISDRRTVICAQQSVDTMVLLHDHILIDGVLTCDDGSSTPYRLTFVAQGDDRLDFWLLAERDDLNRTYLTYATSPDEEFFGFGEQFTRVNMKGYRVPLFVMEQGIGRGAQPITAGANLQARAGGSWYTSYAGVPHYITSQMRSLFLRTYEYAVFDLRRYDRVQVELFSSDMTGTILYGESPADLIASYTAINGRMRPLPDWILGGAVVGMQGGTARVRQVYEQLKAHDVPVAAFWLQDWVGQRTTTFGKQLWWNWVLDSERYPGWGDLVADLEAGGVRVMTYTSPFLADVSEKPGVTRNLFAEAAEAGYLVRNAQGEPYLIENTSFSAGLVDLTNPAAWEWYSEVLRDEVLGAGASGWMADFGEALPYDAVLYSGEPAASVHNRYPELWAQLNREVIDASGQPDQIVAFHRSGYRESPRYATLFWLGDQLVSWDRYDGIKTAVTGLLSSGLSGYAFNHSDIGGYTTITSPIRDYHRSEELLIRWMDLNAFTTIFRTHEGNIPDVNAQFYSSEETLAHFARMAKVYQAWEFYRRELVQEAAETGLPVVRHPFIHYPDDPLVYKITYQQFMVGSELMVAPVLDPGTDRATVYLPAGRWVHVWTGRLYGSEDQGVTITVEALPGYPAVFYRSGSAVGIEFVGNLRAMGLME